MVSRTIQSAQDRLAVSLLAEWKSLIKGGHSFEDVEAAIDDARCELERWINRQLDERAEQGE